MRKQSIQHTHLNVNTSFMKYSKSFLCYPTKQVQNEENNILKKKKKKASKTHLLKSSCVIQPFSEWSVCLVYVPKCCRWGPCHRVRWCRPSSCCDADAQSHSGFLCNTARPLGWWETDSIAKHAPMAECSHQSIPNNKHRKLSINLPETETLVELFSHFHETALFAIF